MVSAAGAVVDVDEEEVDLVGEGPAGAGFGAQSPSSTFRCSACSFSSRSRSLVMRHEHIAHVLKKRFFRCGKCSYATHVKARYTKHVKYHSMPMIKCERCDFRTPYKWNLDRHCKNHLSDPSANTPGAFRCPICDFSADIKQSLTVHVQNHHLSPEQVQARAARRRNKVGASDSAEAEAAAISAGGTIDSEEMELLRMEREENYYQGGTFGRMSLDANRSTLLRTEEPTRVSTPSSTGSNKLKVTIKRMRGPSATQEQNERHNFQTDFIHPDDIIQKNGQVYIKNMKCSYCSFKAAWEGDLLRHESKAHGIEHPKLISKSSSVANNKKCPRPVPNLIPIQGKGATPVSPSASTALPILRIPSLRGRALNEDAPAGTDVEVTMSDKDMNALINAESSRNSALKDFASLIGDLPDDAEGTSRPSTPPKNSAAVGSVEPAGTPETVNSEPTSISPPTPSKKTFASFFDRLKEKLQVGGGDGLICEICHHESKCLSEKARHQKLHDSTPEGMQVEENVTTNTTTGKKGRLRAAGNVLMALSSTRCQHCRQRCKTSADLMVHLQSCLNSMKDEKGEGEEEDDEEEVMKKAEEEEKSVKAKADAAKEAIKDTMEEEDEEEEGDADEEPEEGEDGEPHPMENKVFVWNNCAQAGEGSASGGQVTQTSSASDGEGGGPQSGEDVSANYGEDGEALVGVETAPGIGAITGRGGYEGEISPGGRVTMKKVFKCPQCPFWATTASRFHVHAVGHLNRKPFECSACGYRSNWRWDITKHIRLRAAWDEAHCSPPEGSDGAGPRVLMTDETGRRNYSKYNRHLTVVRVHEMLSTEQGTVGEGSPMSSPLPQTTLVENAKVTKSMVMLLPAPPRLTPAPVQPAPPRLTPAPMQPGNVVDDGEATPPLLRPPPPLRAAASSASASRRPNLLNSNNESQVQAEGVMARGVKRPAIVAQSGEPKEGGSAKRTLWKCKKCNYRDASRELILAHVRQHYAAPQQPQLSRPPPLQRQPKVFDKSDQKMDAEDGSEPMDISGDEPLPGGKGGETKPYQCGHCGRISNWKHVIQRHCRLKHGGVVLVIEQPNAAEDENMDPANSWKCDKCPYRAADLIELQTHATHHVQRPGAVFKCSFCPYYVFERMHLVGHMRLHGASLVMKSPNSTEEPEEPTKEEMKKSEGNEGGKRYSCVGCPYVSDSKSQFLYHKQFHRPRGVAPFKCSFCSYSVSRRHLLHQHLRVHGVSVPANMREDDLRVNVETPKRVPVSRVSQPVLDTSRLSDVPLVWVSRAGKFQKMFKCRFCPHVNVRKINIQEHEKMHKQRKIAPLNPRHGQLMQGMDSPLGNSPKVGASPHKCPQCNYSCNNAGVLSAHAKVHLDSYGKVHCLVDVNRGDEEQIAELEANSMLSNGVQPESDIVGADFSGVSGNTNGISGGSSSGIGSGVPNSVVGAGGQTTAEEDVAECAPEVPEVPDSGVDSSEGNVLHFCPSCPARFVFERELVIHRRFHGIRLPFKCEACSYAARQRPHLLAHLKVHTREYQEKSAALMSNHTVSSHHPRPRIATALPNDLLNPESMWIVDPKPPPPSPQVAQENSTEPPQGSTGASSPAVQPNKHYACDRCPARFFKSVALQYHLTLHGGPGPYRCRTCDYAVKTYGNLVRHEMIHGSSDTPTNRNTSISHNSQTVIPLSGTDLFRQREAAGQAENIQSSPNAPAPSPVTPSTIPPTVDPQFGTLMHGNPEFIYPTYFKNGKLKEKRYKCHKCPSAFEKREQYKVHLSLHGSKQRYRCDKCDYAVKYCANYIQHVRKHTRCEEARLARQQQQGQQQQDSTSGMVQNLNFETPPPPLPVASAPPSSSSHSSPSRPVKSIAPAVPPSLSMAEKQQALLRRLRLEAAGAQEREEEERRKRNVFLCLRCPYSTHRKDSLEAHMRRHPGASELSVAPSAFPCPFCDYAAPQSHFLREHIKVHFRATKTLPKPEAYLSIEKVELWEGDSKEEGNLIFRDSGMEGFERFLPPDDGSEMEEGSDDSGRTYVDPESGEIIQASEVSSEGSVLGQTGEEAVEMKNEDAIETKGKDLVGDWTIGDVLDEDDSSRDREEVEYKTMECTSVN